MRWATAGTILAAREALTHRLVVNLSGGYHHAKPDRGEGFSIYADVAIAVAMLRREGLLGEEDRVVHVDCDAHQGNGVCHCFLRDSRAFLFDMYNQAIYPASDDVAKRRIDHPVPLAQRTRDADYLAALRSELPKFLDGVSGRGGAAVQLAFYNAGTDIFIDDELGGLDVSAAGVLTRDQFVIQQLAERGIPTVMLLSGGYSRRSFQLVAETVQWSLERWNADR
jgi:histone deacetylase 11